MIYLSVFISGFCIMAIELLGGRLMAPYFGSSIYVWGSVITVFMLALSFGYLLGGKMSQRHTSVTLYGCFFIVSGLLALCLVEFSQVVLQVSAKTITDPRYGSLLASTALFFPCTMIAGAISPYSVKLKTKTAEGSGLTAGRLYFVSTLGSAAGTLAASFYLVLWLEINHILALIGIVLIATGFALLVNRR